LHFRGYGLLPGSPRKIVPGTRFLGRKFCLLCFALRVVSLDRTSCVCDATILQKGTSLPAFAEDAFLWDTCSCRHCRTWLSSRRGRWRCRSAATGWSDVQLLTFANARGILKDGLPVRSDAFVDRPHWRSYEGDKGQEYEANVHGFDADRVARESGQHSTQRPLIVFEQAKKNRPRKGGSLWWQG
jgi:hypothetical protein